MQFGLKRAGALASVMVMLGAAFGTIGAGASAHDQTQSDTAIADETRNPVIQSAPDAPEVRFVANGIVQDIPEPESDTPETPASAASLRELVAATRVTSDNVARAALPCASGLFRIAW